MFGSSTTTNHSPPTLTVVETGSVLPTSTSSMTAVSCSPARPTTTTTTNRPSAAAAKPNTNVFASPTNLRKSFQSLLNSTIQGSNNNNNHTSMAYHNHNNISKKHKNGPRRNSTSSTSPSVKTMAELAVVPQVDEILSQVRVTPETIQRVVHDTRQFAHIQAQLRTRLACTNTLAAALHVRLIRQGEQELQQRQAKAQQQVALLEQINQVNEQWLTTVGSASNHPSTTTTTTTTSGSFKDIVHLDSLQQEEPSSSFSKDHARLGQDHTNGSSSSSSSISPKTVMSMTEFTPSVEAHFLVDEEEYYQAFLQDENNNDNNNNEHPNHDDNNIPRDVSPSWTARSVTTMILQSP